MKELKERNRKKELKCWGKVGVRLKNKELKEGKKSKIEKREGKRKGRHWTTHTKNHLF